MRLISTENVPTSRTKVLLFCVIMIFLLLWKELETFSEAHGLQNGMDYNAVVFSSKNKSLSLAEDIAGVNTSLPSSESNIISDMNYANNKRDKPYLVVHVGPPKTGTSTLQAAFRSMSMQGILAQDIFTYNKNIISKIMDRGCHQQLAEQRKIHNETNNDAILLDRLQNVKCWNKTLEILEPFRKSKTNIMYSYEAFSFHSNRISTERGYSMVDWLSLHLTLCKDWNFVFVFSYRRYPEWIFSAYKQINRWTNSKPRMNKWPGMGGKRLQSVDPLPSSRKTMLSIPYRYANSLKQEMQRHPEISTVVFNMHLEQGLASTFFCDILPNAPHSCQRSLQQDQEQTTEIVNNPSQSLFYDALGVAASESGRINSTRYKRHDVAAQLQAYQEETLQQGPFDFALTCPLKSQLDHFLNLSLSLEKDILPEFAASKGVREEHISSFWKTVDLKKFCWIDTDAVLKNSTWEDYFLLQFGMAGG